MKKSFAVPLLALSVGLTACSSQAPNASLEQARQSLATLQGDPRALQLAALETQDAADSVGKAVQAYNDKENVETVDHLSYVASQRVALAQQTIALKTAEQRVRDTSGQRDQARLDIRNAEIERLRKELDAKQTDRGSVVTFGDVLFDLNKADLKPAAQGNLRKLAAFLKDSPERQVLVEGFTDSTGADAYNQSLSERRAESVKRALVHHGINGSRITTQGLGKDYPVADNASESGRAMNRRVEVTISHDAQQVAPRR